MSQESPKFTPGPWRPVFYSKSRTWGVRSLLFAVANCVEQDEQEDELNARLIAEAPEMLAILGDFVDRIRAQHVNCPICGALRGTEHPRGCPVREACAVRERTRQTTFSRRRKAKAARAALKWATGDTE